MVNATFLVHAETMLGALVDAIEKNDIDALVDVEYLDGVITVELESGAQYVINQHLASEQIWLSSPFSGAGRFTYTDGQWIDREGRNLTTLLSKEFNDIGIMLGL